jgi:hypothetical protein
MLRLPRLTQAAGRVAVLSAAAGVTALVLTYVYAVRVAGVPMRMVRDQDGLWRWMTRRDVLGFAVEVRRRGGAAAAGRRAAGLGARR